MLKIGPSIVFCLLQVTVGASVSLGATTPCTIGGAVNFAPAVADNLFPRDAPIGKESPPYSTIVEIDCIADTVAVKLSFYVRAPDGVNVPGSTYNFQTNVPNVAVRYDIENGPSTSCSPYSEGWPSHVKQVNRTINCTLTASAQPKTQIFNLKMSAYFLKTGNGTTGNLTTIAPVVINEYTPDVSATANVFSGARPANSPYPHAPSQQRQ
ncbi:hypothetical protein [Caballeronia sordidicola]|uniref:hypothetical protein n=1 Tax=Caballeronia sordidicola TaxID=196367 RepID=UPI001269885C|nr:hypothetical protein [Caballeronia sordidicola]